MAFRITNICINCGACEGVCPVNCISPGEEIFVIDEEKCIDCGSCQSVCPVEAPQEV